MRRILLALDQKENQRLLRDELEREHEVVLATDGGGVDRDADLLVFDGPPSTATGNRSSGGARRRSRASSPSSWSPRGRT